MQEKTTELTQDEIAERVFGEKYSALSAWGQDHVQYVQRRFREMDRKVDTPFNPRVEGSNMRLELDNERLASENERLKLDNEDLWRELGDVRDELEGLRGEFNADRANRRSGQSTG